MKRIASTVTTLNFDSSIEYSKSSCFLSNSSWSSQSNGVTPVIKLKRIVPIDQISAFYVYLYFFKISGAILRGVPRTVPVFYYGFSFFENPKSATLI